MPGTKELRRRLVSVRNTRKITSAMKLVSAAKLRRAQESVVRSRDYTGALNGVLANLLRESGGLDEVHPLMEVRTPAKRLHILVIGGSRGLCGAYNSNISKKMEALIRSRSDVEWSWTMIGKKPAEQFRKLKRPYVKSYEDLPEDANRWSISSMADEAEELFLKGEVDEVYVLFTKFKSALSMSVTLEKLLPLAGDELMAAAGVQGGSNPTGRAIFEPSVEELFNAVLPRIVRTKLRQACLDAKASEHASRMTAMESATKNAGDLAKRLQLTYNKVRQGSITAELLDIIGGAEAIKG